MTLVAVMFVARLHDDAGSGEVVIERFSFERPTVGERMTTSAEHKAPRAGGLYVATLGSFKAAIIVPPIVKGLAELQCEPKIDTAQRTPETITKLMSFAQLWGKARLSGDLIAGARRGVVLRALTAHIVALLGGRAWASAESKLKDERGLVEPLVALVIPCNSRPLQLVAIAAGFDGDPVRVDAVGSRGEPVPCLARCEEAWQQRSEATDHREEETHEKRERNALSGVTGPEKSGKKRRNGPSGGKAAPDGRYHVALRRIRRLQVGQSQPPLHRYVRCFAIGHAGPS